MRPRPFGRGNVAPHHALPAQGIPSMRPRPFGRGNRVPIRHIRPHEQPSMRPRPSGRGNVGVRSRDRSMVSTFNAATTFRPWKPSSPTPRTSVVAILQCGHDLSAVEPRGRRAHSRPPSRPFNAATTFRPWRRRGTMPRCRSPPTFNAATTFRPWRLRSTAKSFLRSLPLQCGHDLSAVER